MPNSVLLPPMLLFWTEGNIALCVVFYYSSYTCCVEIHGSHGDIHLHAYLGI